MIAAANAMWLFEATVRDRRGGGTRVIRLATGKGFNTSPSDTPDSEHYQGRLMQAIDVTRSLFSPGATSGRSTIAPGSVIVNNADGALDDWLYLSFDGKRARFLYSDDDTAPYSGFTEVFIGTMDFPDFNNGTIAIKLRDRQRELDAPLQLQRYAGTNVGAVGLEGNAGDLKGKTKPLLYGSATKFAARLVNPYLLAYQISTESVDDCTDVYDKGAPLGREADYADMADYLANSPSAGCYRFLNSATYSGFRLGSSPAGLVTCDAGRRALSFPRLTDFDAFMLPDGPVDPLIWNPDPFGLGASLTIESHQLKGPNGGNASIGSVSNTVPNDVDLWAELAVVGHGGVLTIGNVSLATFNGYGINYIPDTGWLGVFVITGGVTADVCNGTVFLADGDAFGMRRQGDVCQAWARLSGVWTLIAEGVNTAHNITDGSVPVAWSGLSDTRISAIRGGYNSPLTFPATLTIDDFERANGPVSNDPRWTGISVPNILQVTSGALACFDAGIDGALLLQEYGPDFEFWFLFDAISFAPLFNIWEFTHADAAGNGYRFRFQNWIHSGSFVVERLDAGVATTTVIAAIATSVANPGDGIGFRRLGNIITLWERVAGVWSQVGDSAVDSTHRVAGQLSFFTNDGTGFTFGEMGGGTLLDHYTHADLFQAFVDRANSNRSDPTLFTVRTGDVSAYRAADPNPIGLYIDEELKLTEALDLASGRGGAWWGMDAYGVLRVEQLIEPRGTPAVEFTENDVIPPLERLGTRDEDRGVPVYRYTIRHSRNYVPQLVDIAGVVSDVDRGAFALEWREATYADALVKIDHELAVEVIVDSLYITEAGAYAEARRRQKLRGVLRHRFEFITQYNARSLTVDLGAIVSLRHPRFGLSLVGSSGGQLFKVMGVAPTALTNRVRLTLWGSALTISNLLTEAGDFLLTEAGDYILTE